MFFVVILASIFAFYKTIGYAIYEYQDNSNKIAGAIIGFLAVIALVRANYCFSYQVDCLSCFAQDFLFHLMYNFLLKS